MRLNKEEVLAYVVMEESFEPTRAQNVEVFDKNNIFYA